MCCESIELQMPGVPVAQLSNSGANNCSDACADARADARADACPHAGSDTCAYACPNAQPNTRADATHNCSNSVSNAVSNAVSHSVSPHSVSNSVTHSIFRSHANPPSSGTHDNDDSRAGDAAARRARSGNLEHPSANDRIVDDHHCDALRQLVAVGGNDVGRLH
jgi:hypothetical protein